MFTVCPKCSLKLVVTAADLRVAQGYVRCGRCANVFNALVRLSDEEQAALSREESSRDARSGPEPRTELAGEERADAPLSDASLEFDATRTDVSEVFVEARLDDASATGQSEVIILRAEPDPSDGLEPTGEVEASGEIESAVEIETSGSVGSSGKLGPSDELELSADAAEPARPPEVEHLEQTDEFELADLEALLESGEVREGESAPAPSSDRQAGEVGEVAREDDAIETIAELAPAEARVRGRLLGAVGAAALALLLAAQLVQHYRMRLAEVPRLARPLKALYASLGRPIAPHWNVEAYEVRQLGAVVMPGAPGALTVRASIENTAPREQPLPLLRVIVEDRFGNRVAARDVRPQAYLPRASAALGYLGAGQRVDAEVAFVDPGPAASGFVIDACLEDVEGRIACAHQARSGR